MATVIRHTWYLMVARVCDVSGTIFWLDQWGRCSRHPNTPITLAPVCKYLGSISGVPNKYPGTYATVFWLTPLSWMKVTPSLKIYSTSRPLCLYSEKRKMGTYWDVSQYHWVLVIAAPWPLSSPITLNIAILQYSSVSLLLNITPGRFFSFELIFNISKRYAKIFKICKDIQRY